MKKKKEIISAFLGPDTEFEGKLSFHGAVRIDGRFKGEISTDGTLIVGEGGEIQAEIKACRVLISGEVRGDIVAREKIDIVSPGKVFGNIEAAVVTVEEGVFLEGNCVTRTHDAEGDSKVAFLNQQSEAKNEI
ncbi:MAG: polymer-forming cytoskeletal protein [Desulfobacteraceae bacterium]